MLQSSLLAKFAFEKKHLLPFEIRISFLKCFYQFHFAESWGRTNALQVSEGDWIPIRWLTNNKSNRKNLRCEREPFGGWELFVLPVLFPIVVLLWWSTARGSPSCVEIACVQIARDPKDIQDRYLGEPLPRKNNISTVSSIWWRFSSQNTNLKAGNRIE